MSTTSVMAANWSICTSSDAYHNLLDFETIILIFFIVFAAMALFAGVWLQKEFSNIA